MIRTARVAAAEAARTPTPASTIIGDIRLLALLVVAVVAARYGDSAVFDRAEGSGGDVMATSGLAPGRAEPRGDDVNFGTHRLPVAIWGEYEHVRMERCRHFRVGVQVIRQGAESTDERDAFAGVGVSHVASLPFRICGDLQARK
jgi:hypothetical protein